MKHFIVFLGLISSSAHSQSFSAKAESLLQQAPEFSSQCNGVSPRHLVRSCGAQIDQSLNTPTQVTNAGSMTEASASYVEGMAQYSTNLLIHA